MAPSASRNWTSIQKIDSSHSRPSPGLRQRPSFEAPSLAAGARSSAPRPLLAGARRDRATQRHGRGAVDRKAVRRTGYAAQRGWRLSLFPARQRAARRRPCWRKVAFPPTRRSQSARSMRRRCYARCRWAGGGRQAASWPDRVGVGPGRPYFAGLRPKPHLLPITMAILFCRRRPCRRLRC